MPQFFTDQLLEVGLITRISGREAHHIIDVLRLKEGDWLILSDGKGKSFKAEIKSVKSKMVEVNISTELPRKFNLPSPALAVAVIKHDRTEYIIQKAVELGISNIFPFFSSRTIPKYTTKVSQEKLDRWKDIALEAAKQSGLPIKPEVKMPVEFSNLCSLFKNYQKSLLFWEGEKRSDIKSEVSGLKSQVLLIIGPEGGFSQEEVDYARERGVTTVSLGSQILRVETAAIVALGIVQYELGNLS